MKLSHISFLFALGMAATACGGSSSDSKNQDATAPVVAGAGAPATGDDDSADIALTTPSQNGLFNVAVTWSPKLEAGTLENTAIVHFHTSTGEHADATLKSFKLYMTTMGHGSIKTDKMTLTKLENDPGHWEVGNIYFSMPGAPRSWAVDIEAELNGQTDKARVVIDAEVL